MEIKLHIKKESENEFFSSGNFRLFSCVVAVQKGCETICVRVLCAENRLVVNRFVSDHRFRILVDL